MKIAKIVAIIICAISLAQINCDTTSDESLEIEDINNLFEIGDRAVDLNGQEDVILLIGGTGTGKSTLSKFLRQDPSLQIIQNAADDFVFADGEEKIGNDDNHMSKTLFPHVDKDEQSGVLLVDCAGFEDTRHPMYDLLASFFTQKVFNKAQKMKIVVVESFERMRLSSDRTAFMRTIKQLAQLLQDEVASFHSSIGLVATKADSSKSDEQLEKSVNVFLDETLSSMQKKRDAAVKKGETSSVKSLERQILLLQFLAAGDKVAIFRRPDDLQSPWMLPPLIKNFAQIRDLLLKNLHNHNTKNQKFQVSVAPETVIYIQNELFTASEQKLQKILNDVGNTLILDFQTVIEKESTSLKEDITTTREFILNYTTQMTKVDSTHSLLHFFRLYNINSSLVLALDLEMRKVEFLCTVVGSDVENFNSQVHAMYGMWEKIQSCVGENENFFQAAETLLRKSDSYEIYAKPSFAATVKTDNYGDFMTYLLSLNLDTSIFLAASHVKPTLKQVNLLNKIKTAKMDQSIGFQKRNNFVTYSGKYILSSQIQNTESIKGELIIMATQKFFIDRDLTLTDTHLTIMAPIVEVIGAERALTLKGSKGASFRTCPIYGAKGMDGNPGLSSGQVKLIALDVVNAQALTIRSKGGDGSDGQPGGHGLNGIASNPPDDLQKINGKKDEVYYHINALQYKVFSWKDSTLQVSNDKRSWAPTDGADGGNGGAAALPGDVTLALKNTATQIATESSIGKGGEGGLGGKAGNDAPVCAIAEFNCDRIPIFLMASIKRYDTYKCTAIRNYNCSWNFPSARNGKNGINLPYLEKQMHKVSPMANFEEQVHDYCKIAVASAALEQKSKVLEFLQFVFSLKGAGTHLQNRVCSKKL